MDTDGDVALSDQDEALGLRDARRSDLVETREEPGAQQETGDVAGTAGNAGAVGDEVITADQGVPQAQACAPSSQSPSSFLKAAQSIHC